ncbi:MAG: branched-chain amino acid aminotransferase [Hyphomicrobiaceae bacterium]|nr:branched-chain amino acid aminotransferase [Hyphomicrobiaceae bacterium]MCC0023277.1 branched-chain amino acid aminotransferase [Hyphomicrobiaceae bacterium]
MAGIPMDQREGWIWFDGEMVPWQDAKVHVLTHGLHYASCVFEGQRAYGGEVFKLTEHSQRLVDSGRMLDMPSPYSVEEINQACRDVLAKNNLVDAYMRPVMWRGSEEMGIVAKNNTTHLAIATWEWPSYFTREERLKGIKLTISDWRRPDPMTIPSKAKAAGLYMICTLSKHAAMNKGFTDAMMLDYRGYVAEATGANIFFHKDGELHTPTPDCFLNGLTRQTVIGLARDAGLKVVERHIMPEQLGDFDECFLTGTAAEITPVSQIDDAHYVPGKVCNLLIDAYTDAVQPKKLAAE